MELDREDAQERHGGMVLERIRKDLYSILTECTGPERMKKESQVGDNWLTQVHLEMAVKTVYCVCLNSITLQLTRHNMIQY